MNARRFASLFVAAFLVASATSSANAGATASFAGSIQPYNSQNGHKAVRSYDSTAGYNSGGDYGVNGGVVAGQGNYGQPDLGPRGSKCAKCKWEDDDYWEKEEPEEEEEQDWDECDDHDDGQYHPEKYHNSGPQKLGGVPPPATNPLTTGSSYVPPQYPSVKGGRPNQPEKPASPPPEPTQSSPAPASKGGSIRPTSGYRPKGSTTWNPLGLQPVFPKTPTTPSTTRSPSYPKDRQGVTTPYGLRTSPTPFTRSPNQSNNGWTSGEVNQRNDNRATSNEYPTTPSSWNPSPAWNGSPCSKADGRTPGCSGGTGGTPGKQGVAPVKLAGNPNYPDRSSGYNPPGFAGSPGDCSSGGCAPVNPSAGPTWPAYGVPSGNSPVKGTLPGKHPSFPPQPNPNAFYPGANGQPAGYPPADSPPSNPQQPFPGVPPMYSPSAGSNNPTYGAPSQNGPFGLPANKPSYAPSLTPSAGPSAVGPTGGNCDGKSSCGHLPANKPSYAPSSPPSAPPSAVGPTGGNCDGKSSCGHLPSNKPSYAPSLTPSAVGPRPTGGNCEGKSSCGNYPGEGNPHKGCAGDCQSPAIHKVSPPSGGNGAPVYPAGNYGGPSNAQVPNIGDTSACPPGGCANSGAACPHCANAPGNPDKGGNYEPPGLGLPYPASRPAQGPYNWNAANPFLSGKLPAPTDIGGLPGANIGSTAEPIGKGNPFLDGGVHAPTSWNSPAFDREKNVIPGTQATNKPIGEGNPFLHKTSGQGDTGVPSNLYGGPNGNYGGPTALGSQGPQAFNQPANQQGPNAFPGASPTGNFGPTKGPNKVAAGGLGSYGVGGGLGFGSQVPQAFNQPANQQGPNAFPGASPTGNIGPTKGPSKAGGLGSYGVGGGLGFGSSYANPGPAFGGSNAFAGAFSSASSSAHSGSFTGSGAGAFGGQPFGQPASGDWPSQKNVAPSSAKSGKNEDPWASGGASAYASASSWAGAGHF